MAHWIANVVKSGKGKLHQHLGVPSGEKIPQAKLESAKNSKSPTIRREAALAHTLSGFHHKKHESPGHNVMHKLYHSK